MVNFSTAPLDRIFAAISDPTRRAILGRLAQGETSIKELAAPFALSLPAITKHLSVLEQAGLMARRKQGRTHYCRLEAQPLGEAAAWLAFYQKFWDAQLQSLDDYLTQAETEPKHGSTRRQSRPRAQRSARAARHA
jgi:DNA-binding transcriptional ArsR family regulator